MPCATLHELPPPVTQREGWPWTEESRPLQAVQPNGKPWPQISIITASYNQGQYIEETIRTILLQGYPNLEYMILDGGSNDQTHAIIERYRPWIDFVFIDVSTSYVTRLDMGLRRATGEIQAWLNSDDLYRPGALERVGRFFSANPQVVFANSDVNYIDAESRYMSRIFAVAPNHMLTANLGYHRWPQQGCFWRAWAYERVGGLDLNLRFTMDRDLYLKLITIGPGKRIPGSALADFRIHVQAKSSTMLHVASQENDQLIRKYGHSTLRARYALLRLLWWLWCKPTNLRAKLNRAYGWEL